MFEVQLETYHKPLCLAPTLRPARAVLDVASDWQVLRLKQEIQSLCRTVSGQSMLAPSRQMLSVKQVDEDSGELRNVGIDDDSALLGVVGLEADSKIYLKVRPYVHRPKEGKPPWCGDFTHGSL